MKKILLFLFISLLLFATGCKSTADKGGKSEKIPGIDVMKTHGQKMSPDEVLNLVGESIREFSHTAYVIYNEVLDFPNKNPVYIIENIEFNEAGLATKIEGHVETPATFREYVRKGGLGIPVYEAKEPNEFGVIFGRDGDVAERDGVIVKLNPLEKSDIYFIRLNAETYDKVTTASVLYQAYQVTKTPYLRNLIIELQGMLLNSGSKDAIIEGVKKYKEENPDMDETEVMINFLKANESYLDKLDSSDEEAKERIRTSKKLLNAIAAGCASQTVALVKHFTEMTAEVAAIVLSMDAGRIASYIARNVPKNMNLKMKDLQMITQYGQYRMKQYQEDTKKNKELWKAAMDISSKI